MTQPYGHLLKPRLHICTPGNLQKLAGASLELLNEVLVLCAGKQCEDESATAALAGLRHAVADRLVLLVGNLDAMLNDEEQLARFCELHWSVLEVGAAGKQPLSGHALS